MKMNKLIGIIAIIAVIGLFFAACEEEASGTAAPGMLKINAKDLPSYEGRTAKTTGDDPAEIYMGWIYWDLWDYIDWDFIGSEAFKAEYGKYEGSPDTPGTHRYDNRDATSYSFKFNKDVSAVALAELKNYFPEYAGTITVTNSNEYKWSSNMTMLTDYNKENGVNGADYVNGDKKSWSGKYKNLFDMNGGKIVLSNWSGTYEITGKVMSEGNYKGNWQLVDKALNKEKSTTSDTWKGAWGFTVTNITDPDNKFGAKLIWVSSNTTDKQIRATKETYGTQGRLEAYDNNNNLIWVID